MQRIKRYIFQLRWRVKSRRGNRRLTSNQLSAGRTASVLLTVSFLSAFFPLFLSPLFRFQDSTADPPLRLLTAGLFRNAGELEGEVTENQIDGSITSSFLRGWQIVRC